MKKIIQVISLFISIIITSCSKDYTEVKIISPNNGQSFTIGNIIEVKAEIDDADYIRSESLLVTEENGDTIYNYLDSESYGNSHTFIKSFEATHQGNYTIKVSAVGDSMDSDSVMVFVN